MASTIRDIYVSALQSTHALELQALQLMQRQVDRLEQYPELEQSLRRHIEETHGQRDRLEQALKAVNETPSVLKEGVLGFVGNVAALAHAPAEDEILKNAFANRAFENYEAAAYQALLIITEAAGQTTFLPGFELSLRQEQAMAQAAADLVAPLTRRYLQLSTSGQKADR